MTEKKDKPSAKKNSPMIRFKLKFSKPNVSHCHLLIVNAIVFLSRECMQSQPVRISKQ